MTSSLPLEGIRVCDLTRYWAGPHCAGLLAHLGAEVIKVEATHGAGLRRQRLPQRTPLAPDDPRAKLYNRVANFDQINVNKLAIALDITSPQGREVLLRLIGLSDVVVNNYSAEMMPKLGLDYETLKAARPDIIACSIPAFGTTGPWNLYLGYGVCLEPLSGYFSVTGYPGDIPTRSGVDHFDPMTGTHAAAAILTALLHRQQTGQGQFIDVSHLESGVEFMGQHLMDYFMNRRTPTRQGNRHPTMAPHNAYRCLGEERWVAIAVGSQQEWQGLVEAMGHPAWAEQGRFSTPEARWQHQEELDQLIEGWTSGREARQVMEQLQKAGVAAGAVLSVADLDADPHLNARGFFQEMDHPEAGRHRLMTAPWVMEGAPRQLRRAAPTYGQDNDYVFGQLLGMGREEMAELAQAEVIAYHLPGRQG